MNEFIDTHIPIVLNTDIEQAELTNTPPEYIIVKARISLNNIKTIHESIYAEEPNVVGIEYHDQDSTTIIDNYNRIIEAHNVYLSYIKNSYLIKSQ